MHPKISIIILNYNGQQFNEGCLESVLTQSYQDFEIILVDNASTDGSMKEVERAFEQEIQSGKIRIIYNPQNDGFAEGNNVGVRISQATDYIWLLNNDIVADKGALRYLVEELECDTILGAIGSLILDKWYEEVIQNQIFKERKKFTTSIFGEIVLSDITPEEVERGRYITPALSGCSHLYRKSLIKEPFEKYYFAYAEDVFLNSKILILWYRLAVSTKSIIHHFWSGSFGKDASDFKLFHGNKNQIINFLVFYSLGQKIALFPLFFMKEIGHLFMGNAWKRLKAKLRAIGWIWSNRSLVSHTREDIKNLNPNGGKALLRTLDFRLSDIFFANKASGLKYWLLRGGNFVFQTYGSILRYFLGI